MFNSLKRSFFTFIFFPFGDTIKNSLRWTNNVLVIVTVISLPALVPKTKGQISFCFIIGDDSNLVHGVALSLNLQRFLKIYILCFLQLSSLHIACRRTKEVRKGLHVSHHSRLSPSAHARNIAAVWPTIWREVVWGGYNLIRYLKPESYIFQRPSICSYPFVKRSCEKLRSRVACKKHLSPPETLPD